MKRKRKLVRTGSRANTEPHRRKWHRVTTKDLPATKDNYQDRSTSVRPQSSKTGMAIFSPKWLLYSPDELNIAKTCAALRQKAISKQTD